MCGINGIVHLNREGLVSRPALERMNKALRHRGPDDEGYYIDKNAGLAMRRLSIIDIQGGHQPISNEDGSIWVVFNGEIYNYKRLKYDLEAHGHKFSTNCDTEVIVHQYEEDGENFLNKLNGMFGIAIWDSKKTKLVIARDRIGIKPLHYYIGSDIFLFSSEPKAIIQHPSVKVEVDSQALWDYLTFRYVPAPRSMFKGIMKMHPGHYGVLENGRFQVKEYWDIPAKDNSQERGNHCLDGRQALEAFEAQFFRSVKTHLMSDVPLGVLLSGGIDSSAVVYAMRRLGIEEIKTFSVGFDAGPDFNELPYARRVADFFKTDHHEIVVGIKEFIAGLEKYVFYADEPLADLACIPLWYVSKLAREEVTVVLSGEGSDEIIAGYPGIENTVLNSRVVDTYQRMPAFLRNAVSRLSNSSLVPHGMAAKLRKLSISSKDFWKYWPKNMTNYFSEQEKERLLGVSSVNFSESYRLITDLYRKQQERSPLDQVLYVYCKYWLADNLLTKADRMTMANSLELRVPFLDHDLIELAFRLPEKLKVDFFLGLFKPTRKAALRRIMRNCLPEEIVNRKKYGFPTPENQWLERELNSFVKDLLYASGSFAKGNFEPSELDSLVKQSDLKNQMAQSKVWLLVVLEAWNKTFIERHRLS